MEEPVVNEREARHAWELMEEGALIPARWFKRQAFASIFFDAGSVSIPEAERLVISTAEEAAQYVIDPVLREKLHKLIAEETAHSRVHDAYNAYLARKGYPVAKYEKEFAGWARWLNTRFSLMTRLAICATVEHFTACISRQILDTGIFEGEDVDERMDRVWTWHALEELDHRAIAFDLYTEMGGTYARRFWSALIGSFLFMYIHNRCFLAFLRKKKLLRRWSAWKIGLPFLFGKNGIYRHFIPDWWKFFHPRFHPSLIPIRNVLKKQLRHYHIESELIGYFSQAAR